MRRITKISLVLFAGLSMLFSACKYEEGPGISFRAKRDRISNEWKVTGYAVDGTEDAALKKSFTSATRIRTATKALSLRVLVWGDLSRAMPFVTWNFKTNNTARDYT